ncbi:MAG: phosphoglycerate mutase family protein [bacterium]
MEKINFETKENIPKYNITKVDFIRHGSTKYEENNLSKEEKDLLGENIPLDLTPEGEEEVKKSAEEIIKKINPEKEIVVLWSSPAWRAQGSESIINQMLNNAGILVYKDSSINQMRSFDQYDKDYMDSVWKKIAPIGTSSELLYARDPEFQSRNDKFESQPEVKERAEQVFNWIRYLNEHINLEDKNLHIIGASHFEFLNPIMEDIFDFRVENGDAFKKGENISIQFNFNKETKETSITADFRGVHKEGIIFDPIKRKFSLLP